MGEEMQLLVSEKSLLLKSCEMGNVFAPAVREHSPVQSRIEQRT